MEKIQKIENSVREFIQVSSKPNNIRAFVREEANKALKLSMVSLDIYQEYIELLYTENDNDKFNLALKVIYYLKENISVINDTIKMIDEDMNIEPVDAKMFLSFMKKTMIVSEDIIERIPLIIKDRKIS